MEVKVRKRAYLVAFLKRAQGTEFRITFDVAERS